MGPPTRDVCLNLHFSLHGTAVQDQAYAGPSEFRDHVVSMPVVDHGTYESSNRR